MSEQDLHELQTVLRLAIAQSQLALDESGAAVDELGSAFLAMAAEVDRLDSIAQGSSPTTELKDAIAAYRQQALRGTIAFQFYDKFSQRMHHLMTTLAELDAMTGTGGLQDPAQWQGLKDSIRQRYTMEQEHRLLDAIEAGASPAEAVAVSAPSQGDDIELF